MSKVCLVIVDGFGIPSGNDTVGAFDSAAFVKKSMKEVDSTELFAHGQYVGLLDGMVGNSEVGHMTIGSGRVVKQPIELVRTQYETGRLKEKICGLKNLSKKVHLIGMLSDAGVHSHIRHLRYLIDCIPSGHEVLVHAISDGIDVPPNTASSFLSQFKNVASVSGRYFAMDRDKNWERTREVFDTLTSGKYQPEKAGDALNGSVPDEKIEPTLLMDVNISKEDTLIMFNYREDRMKQLYSLFRPYCTVYTLVTYNGDDANVIVDKEVIKNTLPELVSKAGLRQAHIAESEKYAHVTYFFNGGRDVEYKNEHRTIIPSQKVPSFDCAPGASMKEVADACLKCLKEQYDFIVINLAAPDLLGHTGNLEKTREAVAIMDGLLKTICDEAVRNSYVLIMTADHGNSEEMVKDGLVSKSHTTNKVPFIVFNHNGNFKAHPNASLADVAPTILKLLEIEIPSEIIGSSLIN